jgi:hypothetical protein
MTINSNTEAHVLKLASRLEHLLGNTRGIGSDIFIARFSVKRGFVSKEVGARLVAALRNFSKEIDAAAEELERRGRSTSRPRARR